MACFYPLDAYQRPDGGALVFWPQKGYSRDVKIPCGQCIGCRLERSRQWAMRMVHEASLHQDNCFITLTYNAENCPPDGGLIKSDWQKFMKRLRRHSKNKVRFYHVGEYGDKFNRPHYHAILFGFNFTDWVYLFDSPSGYPIYTSPTLEKIWQHGFVTIGTVDFQSAAYCARYCVKKIYGRAADVIDEETGLKPYERINTFTGEIVEVLPEYSLMSRGGRTGYGIGHGWIERFTLDCYPKDFTVVNGVRMKPPRYYDRYLEQIDLDMYDQVKTGRAMQSSLSADNTEARLQTREQVKLVQSSKLLRTL